MTLAFLLYYALLVLWLPLIWPMLRVRRRARLLLAAVVAAGLLAALHEVRSTLGTAAEIRFDILLIGAALLSLYALAAVVLFAAGWRRAAAALGLVILLIGGSAAYKWILLGRESERLREVFHARNRLLFEAGFRDRETYERRFGPFTGAPGSHPSGHWLADGPSRFSRLIINGEGRAWLFFPCAKTQCAYGPAGTALEPIGAGPTSQWQASLAPQAGVPLEVTIARGSGDHLTLQANDRSSVFAKRPPPIDPTPARRSLVYLGPFARVTCQGRHAKVRQVWLWREQARLYAVGIFAPLVGLGTQRQVLDRDDRLERPRAHPHPHARRSGARACRARGRAPVPRRGHRTRALDREGRLGPLVRDHAGRPLLRRRHPRLLAPLVQHLMSVLPKKSPITKIRGHQASIEILRLLVVKSLSSAESNLAQNVVEVASCGALRTDRSP
jgi:hypothetical protein